jgi:hypothetical protein
MKLVAAPRLPIRRPLKRDHPQIAARLARGEFRSVRAAAKAAGIVQECSVLDQLRRLWASRQRNGKLNTRS